MKNGLSMRVGRDFSLILEQQLKQSHRLVFRCLANLDANLENFRRVLSLSKPISTYYRVLGVVLAIERCLRLRLGS
jgi:hypothetical protein